LWKVNELLSRVLNPTGDLIISDRNTPLLSLRVSNEI
jgi:hypothetical protein